MKKMLRGILILIVVSNALTAFGQEVFSNYIKDGLYQFDDTMTLTRKRLFIDHKTAFGYGSNDSLVLTAMDTMNANGFVHDRYRQYYKGYPVEPTLINVISKYSVVLRVNGFMIKNLDLDVSSPVSESTARTAALNYVNASMYCWQDTALIDSAIANAYANGDTALADSMSAHAYDLPQGDLVINTAFSDTSVNDSSHYHFCWKFIIPTMAWDTIYKADSLIDTLGRFTSIAYDTIIGYRPDVRYEIYVDATTGDFFSDFTHVDGSYYEHTDCKTPYNGTRAVQDFTTSLGAWKFLYDDHGVNSWDYGRKAYVSTAKWKRYTWDGTSDAAYWAVERAWDYYKYVHGQEGGDFHRYPIGIVDHFKVTPVYGYAVGAAYDHSFDKNKNNPYGLGFPGGEAADIIEIRADRSGSDWSIAQIDVMGHELTHAYIYHNSKVGYVTTESYAVDEGLCDVFGELIANWQIYAGTYGIPSSTPTITNPGFGWWSTDFYRSMSSGHTDFPNPTWEYYNDPIATGSTDPYVLSGPIRHFFGLLTGGGSYRGYTVPAQGVPAIEQDLFVTMTWWCWTNMNLHNFKDQYLAEVAVAHGGVCTPQYKAALSAFQAVNLLPVPLCPMVGINNPHVATRAQVSSNTVHMSVFSTDDGLTPLHRLWRLPSNWSVTMNGDSSDFVITSTAGDWSSKMVTCVVTFPGSVVDSAIAALHFVDSNYGARYATAHPTPFANTQGNASDVQIFPIPTKDIINILLPEQPQNAIMHLLDITGREVYSKPIVDMHSTIYLPVLNSGVYLMRVVGDNVRVNKNIVIQR